MSSIINSNCIFLLFFPFLVAFFRWDRWTCCSLFANELAKSNNYKQARIEITRDYEEINKTAFDAFEPEWDCEVQNSVAQRNGTFTPIICGLRALTKPCLVYSFVSGNNDFERDIGVLRPICEIHKFKEFNIDPKKVTHASGHFNEIASGHRGRGNSLRILEIMKLLGHTNRRIDILKIDCEGCDYDALFRACATRELSIGQLLIKLHGSDYRRINDFFRGADACGLRAFHKERNNWGCGGNSCEYSLISIKAAIDVFSFSHCPRHKHFLLSKGFMFS